MFWLTAEPSLVYVSTSLPSPQSTRNVPANENHNDLWPLIDSVVVKTNGHSSVTSDGAAYPTPVVKTSIKPHKPNKNRRISLDKNNEISLPVITTILLVWCNHRKNIPPAQVIFLLNNGNIFLVYADAILNLNLFQYMARAYICHS